MPRPDAANRASGPFDGPGTRPGAPYAAGGPPRPARPGPGRPTPGGVGPGGVGPGGIDRPTQPVEMVFTDSNEVPVLPGGDVRTRSGAAGPAPTRPGRATERWPDDEAPVGDDYDDDTYYDDYDDYEVAGDDELPKRRGCRNALIVLLVLVVVALVAAWFGWSWVQGKIDPAGAPGDEVLVEIPEGTSTAGIGNVLEDAGVISDAGIWGWYTRLQDVPTIQAGNYQLRLNSSFSEAIDDLASDPLPPEVDLLVTVPPGLTQAQISARLADPENGVPGFTVEGVEAALADPASRSSVLPADRTLLEGTLFPETYAVEEGDTEAVIVQKMVAEFDARAADLDLVARAEAMGRTPYEVLIVASMVEREAGTVADGPKVARVIYNRLAAEEALGIDATSCYEKGEIPCQLSTADLDADTPYNTRTRPGLTPTPIASPGEASIEAALAPAEGPWRWYVLNTDAGDGSSFFTDDYDEFLAAKDRCEAAGQCG